MRTTTIEKTINRIYRKYVEGASSRGYVFELLEGDFYDLITQDCYYCGTPRSNKMNNFWYNGIDRMDNDEGYTLDNCVPCCWMCNRKKCDSNTQEFLMWIDKVYNYQRKIGNL